jgi:hypothetical protein
MILVGALFITSSIALGFIVNSLVVGASDKIKEHEWFTLSYRGCIEAIISDEIPSLEDRIFEFSLDIHKEMGKEDVDKGLVSVLRGDKQLLECRLDAARENYSRVVRLWGGY